MGPNESIKRGQIKLTNAAKLVGVSKPTIMAWIKSGKLKAHRIGTRYYIPDSELARIVEESTQVIN